MARVRVVSVGDAIVDIIMPPMAGLPSGDHQGEVPEVALLPGGNATNFALQTAALGADVTFIGCIGRDPLAVVLRRAYRDLRVRARLAVDPRRETGTTVALTWSDGGRALLTSLGANAGLRERHVAQRLPAKPDHLHRAGFWWTPGLSGSPTVRLLARARRVGTATSLDVSTDPRGWAKARVDAVRVCLPHVDTFFGNEVEVGAIAGDTDALDAANELCRLGVGEVVIHRGPRGATRVAGERVDDSAGFHVPPENPTGCGDVFNAGYVFSRCTGADARQALRFANACAALHLADRRRPYPSLTSVRRFLRRA